MIWTKHYLPPDFFDYSRHLYLVILIIAIRLAKLIALFIPKFSKLFSTFLNYSYDIVILLISIVLNCFHYLDCFGYFDSY